MRHRPLFAALDVDDVPGLSSPLNYRVQKHYLQLVFKFASMDLLFMAFSLDQKGSSVGWLRDQLMISIPNVEWKETREQYIAYIKACCAKINQSYNNVFFAVLSQGASKH